MLKLEDIQMIGDEVALRWNDGQESYLRAPQLRAASPSAESKGEHDIFGQKYGGEEAQEFSDVTVVSWEKIGGYAVRFIFSDGHSSGLYHFELLRELGGA